MNGNPGSEEFLKGVTLIKNEMWEFLARHGLSRIETVGLPFNPEQHEAIDVVEDEERPENTIVAEIRPGYLLHGKLLRPASVKVSKRKETQDQRPKTEDPP